MLQFGNLTLHKIHELVYGHCSYDITSCRQTWNEVKKVRTANKIGIKHILQILPRSIKSTKRPRQVIYVQVIHVSLISRSRLRMNNSLIKFIICCSGSRLELLVQARSRGRVEGGRQGLGGVWRVEGRKDETASCLIVEAATLFCQALTSHLLPPARVLAPLLFLFVASIPLSFFFLPHRISPGRKKCYVWVENSKHTYTRSPTSGNVLTMLVECKNTHTQIQGSNRIKECKDKA